MIPVVGVRFKKAGKIYYFDPGDCAVDVGMRVIVKTTQGVECGEVAIGSKLVPKDDLVLPIRRIIRVANEKDLGQIGQGRVEEKDAFMYAAEQAHELGLNMKVVDAEWSFDRKRLVFYFTAEERVDFRQLVRRLARSYRTRIELRQIGVRDEAKMLGGYGVCGRALCCATWIGDFEPISIRQAKQQELSLNPNKISGVCGRLKCCLRFEVDMYKEIQDEMPAVGTEVGTHMGVGKVIEQHIIKEQVTILVDDGEQRHRLDVHMDDIQMDEATGCLQYAAN